MARNKSLIKLEGSIGDLSFYDSVFGPIVRRKGGPDKKKIKTSPRMVRVREQNREFGEAVKAAKLLRDCLKLGRLKEHSITWRVNKLMNQVKDCDGTSTRGNRTVSKGLATAAGKDLMKGFDIKEKSKLNKIILKSATINTGNQSISISQIVPSKDIKYPKGATHARLKGICARIDFNKKKSEMQESTDVVLLLKSKVSSNVVLQMNPAALNSGYDFYCIYVEFLQEINSVYYDLENKKHNCLNILRVI